MPDGEMALKVLLSVIGSMLVIGISVVLYLYKQVISQLAQLNQYARENAIHIAENVETIRSIQRALYIVEQEQRHIARYIGRRRSEPQDTE